jgi:hypothetical protein
VPKTFVISLLLGFLISPAIAGATVHINSKTKTLPRPISEVFGVRLSMSQKDAHARLKKRGSLEKEARKRQEVWAVNDRRVSHVIVGFDPDYKVRYITAIARTGGPPISYSEIGDIGTAQQLKNQGNYKFTWNVPAQRQHPGYLVVAHGRDHLHLESYSIKRLDVEEVD